MNTKLFQKNTGIIIASIICAIIIASGIRLKVFANVEELTVNNNKEGSNTYTIKIEKKDCSVSVIKYEPAEGSVIEIEENTGGTEVSTGSGEKYYCYSYADHVYDPGARLTVTYTDGSTYTYTADYKETGQRRFVNTSDPNNTNDTIIPILSEKDIQSDNPWHHFQ